MLEENIYRRRYDEIQHVLETNDADFALLTPSPSYQYLTGSAYQMHERLVAMLVTRDGAPRIIAPAFEVSDHQNNTWVKEILPWTEEDDPYKLVVDAL
ncbi:MAG: aminopeptidase P family N-terminal domain-containing protein, partial [Candidatus Thorarchaeota archaeon]